MPHPNKYSHGKTKVIRVPPCFENILFYVCDKLDKDLISEIDLEILITDYITKGTNNIKEVKLREKEEDINYSKVSINSLLNNLNAEEKLDLLKKLLRD